jgi:inorganic pyrophosphatase
MSSRDFLGKIVEVVIDRPLGSKHPKHDIRYGLNYGFIPGTTSDDGEELDAYVMGIDDPLTRFKGRCIAIIHRTNDNDDKLVVVPDGLRFTDNYIRKATDFQEKFFESEIIRKS